MTDTGKADCAGAQARWLERVAALWPVAKGSLSEVEKPGVSRSGGGKRRVYLFSYQEEGRKRCAYVPAAAAEQVRRALANGREVERLLVQEGAALVSSYGREARREAAEGRALRVGVLTELNVLDRSCAYHRELADQTLNLLAERGLAATLYCGRVRSGEGDDSVTCPAFWDAARRRNIDAAVILNVPGTAAWRNRVLALPVPAVGYYTSYEVQTDVGAMIRQGVLELRRQGARRVAMLTWLHAATVTTFRQTVRDLGLETCPRWIGGDFDPTLSGSGWEAFREIWASQAVKPDGLLVTDDVLFQGAAQAIREMGIAVPEQLRVVAHANRTAAAPAPFPHTRCVFDPADEARALVALLERRLAGGAPPEPAELTPFTVESDFTNNEEMPCLQQHERVTRFASV